MIAWYWWLLIGAYGIAGIATMVFHVSLIYGPITNPLGILWTGIAWPFYLPMLIDAWRKERV